MSRVTLSGVLALGVAAAVAAQVPVGQEPRHRVVFEHADFRVFDVNIPPGDTTLDHRHDRDMATVSMNGGTPTRAQAPGQPWSQPRPLRPLGSVNVTEYAGKPASHRVENLGRTAYRLFAVENRKTGGWSAEPPLSSPGAQLAAESRGFRVYDARLEGERSQASHVHRVPSIAVLIGGRVISEGAEVEASAGPAVPSGLKQLDQPGQWVLVPPREPHHLVRLGTVDAHVVEIELR
jgi:hypothetical protein